MHNAWPLNDVGSILTRDPLCSLVCCARAAAVYDWQCLKSICCLFSALCAHKSTHNIYATLPVASAWICRLSVSCLLLFFFSSFFLMYLRLCCVNRRSAVPSYFCRYHRLGRFTSGNIRPHTISLLVLFFCFFFLLSCAGWKHDARLVRPVWVRRRCNYVCFLVFVWCMCVCNRWAVGHHQPHQCWFAAHRPFACQFLRVMYIVQTVYICPKAQNGDTEGYGIDE